MGYQAKFKGWDLLSIEDLLVAYRKAKADCFFENTFPTAIKFAEYEQDLLANLNDLLSRLKSNSGFENDKELLGDFRLLPKKLSTVRKADSTENGHVHFSKPERAVESLFKNYNITPEFRIVGDFPVDAHIISALWINMIGHQFDAKLDDSCYGARLKRIRNDELFAEDDEKPFHISSIGSFVPYFQPYQKWRSDGLKAIRDELEKDRDVIAVSLDLKSYYHFIDPTAISGKALLEALDLKLTDEEKVFTEQLASFLCAWAKGAEKFGQSVGGKKAKISGGLVIGLTCSRVISNALLHRWDKLVLEKLAPIHYGRYVDDMFLVLRDTGTITNSLDLMNMVQSRIGESYISQNAKNDKVWEINQGSDVQGETRISLQSDKQKLFVLQGRAGLDLLDSIEKEIYELSSEHRLMPSPDQLEHSTAAKVLSAAGSVGENADTLRRADGLTIRRLGWSLQLRHVETLARDLPPNQWKEQREEFYQFAHNHILRADNLFAHFTYLPRLLGFAISMNEWEQAEQIAVKSYRAIDALASEVDRGKTVRINGCDAKVLKDLWGYIKGTLTWLFIDAATRYHDPSKLFLGERSSKKKRLADLFLNQIVATLTDFEALLDLRFDVADFENKAPLVASADLAKEAYKYILNSQSAEELVGKRDTKKEKKILKLLGSAELLDVEIFEQFINSTRKTRLGKVTRGQKKNDSYLPYLFPTRPLSPAEISELAPECVGLPSASGKTPAFCPAVTWAKYTQVLRGVWIKPTLLAAEQDANDKKAKRRKKYLKIGTDSKDKVVVALTNLRTEDSDWAATACNKPNLSRKRYQKISKLVNDVLKLNPRPDYVLFPELSIPLRWLNSIAARLSAAGISLIAGTEYRHSEGNKILSEAALVLADNRLGYPTFVKIWQPKLEPAVGEDKDLTVKFGKEWDLSKKSPKPIYIHNGVNFGVMVCSELQNSKSRIRFQGAVDALMVLSWNRDLDTFASLIESAALDVHAYTILVNNRKYGDSRVRSPAKESFLRDIARLRGGDNDFVVAATLDIAALRGFQSRAKRWPEEGDKFKPVPEGFRILGDRRKLPPK
ncbi:RNA-directed DNA polymerase [Halioxenophilus aromaticivorans]|uniref:RNA-directed DNA polymerase n=1 Tax=Halioxenophilus aromaticivorans TaxID=1306992 RepID=A0AAV3U9F3_9ALTE